jgi:omega-6 fatty acid desaturase (delta-12 desaturase)
MGPGLSNFDLAPYSTRIEKGTLFQEVDLSGNTVQKEVRSWKEILGPYERPVLFKSLVQFLLTAALFTSFWILALVSLDYSYWITLLLAIPAAGFYVRLFIIQHDCGHGSFFKSRRANNLLGSFLGVLTLTPYAYWRKTHAVHHATTGNLDRRHEFGDIRTLTVQEYSKLSPLKRIAYRLYRNPIILFGVGSGYQFLLKHRFPFDLPRSWKREWASVVLTNLAILAVLVLMWQTIGLQRFLLVQLPITLLGGSIGTWFFFVHHQFENTYWARQDNWDFHTAAFRGSSYYDLPRFLNWISGSIGVHHVHHLSSAIPNYQLLRCHRENPELQEVLRITLWNSLKCARLKLWDEEKQKLVGFRVGSIGAA